MATPKPPPNPAQPPAILVLEEYAALAAAIASALRKFAAGHRSVMADSLVDAETLARELEPELVIVDCDPPKEELLPSLWQFWPGHRSPPILALTAGLDDRLRTELAGGHSSIAFLEKPFDVQNFGRAVGALLAAGNKAEPRLADLLVLLCLSQTTLRLGVKGPGRKTGEIEVREGRITHAAAGDLAGAAALPVLLCWRRTKVSELPGDKKRDDSITEPWQPLLVQALRYANAVAEPEIAPEPRKAETANAAPPQKLEPPKAPEPDIPKTAPSPPKPDPPLPVAEIVSPAAKKPPAGKKVVVIDDTELLLLFVEHILSEAEPDLRITTAATSTEGLRLIEEIKPDLILLDFSLPDFNGDEVCARLLADGELARIPVLMMSGHVPEMTATARKCWNVIATLPKPFRSEQLIHEVRRALTLGPLAEPPAKPAAEPPPKATATPIADPGPTEKPAKKESGPGAAMARQKRPVSPPAALEEPPKPRVPVAPPPLPEKLFAPPRVEAPSMVAAPALAPAPAAQTAVEVMAPIRTRLPGDRSEVIVSLSLEVTAMQLTPELRIGVLRTRPAQHSIVLRFASPAMRGAIPPESGFELGPVQLNPDGSISEVRVVPMPRPVQFALPRLAFEISDVSVVAANSHNRLQILPAPAAPMTVQMLARFELSGVELSPSFQVAALALMGDHDAVRISLEQKASPKEEGATEFDIASIELDAFSRIAALQLTPRK